jgi:hypothetical protein
MQFLEKTTEKLSKPLNLFGITHNYSHKVTYWKQYFCNVGQELFRCSDSAYVLLSNLTLFDSLASRRFDGICTAPSI